MEVVAPISSASFGISDPTQIGEARRFVATTCTQMGFDEEQTGRASIIATELASNLVKHTAEGGEIIVNAYGSLQWRELQMIALDRGPGMANVARSMSDGYSTAGSPGTGLGAISRLASEFDIFSREGLGSTILASVRSGESSGSVPLTLSGLSIARPREDVCGDCWNAVSDEQECFIAVVDGLGHGQGALMAATEAVVAFRRNASGSPAAIIQRASSAARHTRGAAMSVVRINPKRNEITHAGVGNIGCIVVDPDGTKHMISQSGIVGGEQVRITDTIHPWSAESMLILYSDGLQSRLSLDGYLGLQLRKPGLIAGILYRDFSRRNDDSTVVVVQNVFSDIVRP